MAFTDPQTVTHDGAATSLPRILTGTQVGNFVSADAKLDLTIDPRGTTKRRRNVARLYVKRTAPDPVVPTALISVQDMVSFTIDRPQSGVADADIEKDAVALLAWLTANTNANLKRLIAGEN